MGKMELGVRGDQDSLVFRTAGSAVWTESPRGLQRGLECAAENWPAQAGRQWPKAGEECARGCGQEALLSTQSKNGQPANQPESLMSHKAPADPQGLHPRLGVVSPREPGDLDLPSTLCSETRKGQSFPEYQNCILE